jgi:hypothetical protein
VTTPTSRRAPAQLRALLVLRWQMLRTPGARIATVLSVLLLLWLLRAVALSGRVMDPVLLDTALEVAPAAFLGFGMLAMVAPLTSGGGQQVVPPDELVAYPVRPATLFLGGLVLAPANLVWAVQLVSLVALTAYLTLDGHPWLGAATTLAFVACLTAVGQALAWTVVGLRQRPVGRQVVNGTGIALGLTALVVIHQGWAGSVVAASPTRAVVRGVIAGGQADTGRWAWTTGALLAVGALALLAGVRACGWALRRPGDAHATRHTGPLPRRAAQRGALRELIAVDRASVWRAPALRRGGLVLVVLPGVVAAALQVPWTSLLVLPGLVAAGAGLLFGVNAFALDASGAVWLASMPSDPVLLLRSKLVVLTETVLGADVVAALAGAAGATGTPTPAQVAGLVGGVVACTSVVVALSLSASLRRPHKAELRGPRDAVAPPGALAAASVRLAFPCALVGMVIATSSELGVVWLPLLVAVPPTLLAVLSLLRSERRFADPRERARVVQAVAAGA